jgi:ABC-type glycerol-3-phosphate transport system permease component
MLFLAPTYDMLVHIGWIDSYAALLVPSAANAFGMFLFRQAMLSVPNSLIEAARVDGASEFRIYSRIVMPLVQPMTAAFCLIVFMGQWNTFLAPQIFIQSDYKLTVPVILSQYVSQFQEEYGMFLAGTFLSIVPIAVLFLTLQREFISELTTGAKRG